LALAGIVYAFYRYRINELLKRQAMRNKIAQDLHDNVGSTLSSISVYSQVAKIYHNQKKQDDLEQTLEKIGTASSEMISELNDTVWAINPRNDHMSVILQRMESFARPLLAAKGIKFHFAYDENLMHVNLSMEKRKNFYLIYKEAINNTLKYAECQNLFVTLKLKRAQLVMRIEDDGKGFDVKKSSEGFKSSDVFGGGNGLKNMQLRAREMNARLNIRSEVGRGTGIVVFVPITRFGDFPFRKKK
jgi:signal transduction histidine kinase